MDSYIAETESRIDELLRERAELLADIESLQRENEALHSLVDELSKSLETMSE